MQKLPKILKNPIIVNSSWGIIAQVLQSIFLSLFFVVITRNYSTKVFASFIIATVLYQLIAAFSSLGLSQWFIREITDNENKTDIVNKFFKLQIYLGVIFYVLNISLGYLLYDDRLIHILAILLGLNIIFDNLINAIKCINVAEFKQKKTFIILSIDAFLKFTVACLLILFPFSVISLSITLIVIRFLTLNLFLKIGSSKLINFKLLLQFNISVKYIKELICLNWPFIIIGGVSILNWRIATIIISKTLSSFDVASYEISFRIFSIALMLPVVVSTTVFPTFVRLFKEGNLKELNQFYRKTHLYYFLFSLFAFTFVYSFIDFLIPAIFGSTYIGTGIYTKQMFLTILIFPTAFLQANMLMAMSLEKLDMWFNIVNLIINLTLCLIGIYFLKSLTSINISIFFAFLVFHILQDLTLVKKELNSRGRVWEFYYMIFLSIGSYFLLSKILNPILLFCSYWIIIILLFFLRNEISKFRKICLLRLMAKQVKIKMENRKRVKNEIVR